MNGSCRLSLQLWMARANTSLPVPLSPRSNTVDLLEAAFLAVSIASRIFELSPPIKRYRSPSSSLKRSRPLLSRSRSRAFSTMSTNMVEIEWLRDKIKRSLFHCLHGPLDAAVSRDHNCGRVAPSLS